MRAILAAVFCLASAVSLAQSQPPAPTPTEPSREPQGQTGTEQQRASTGRDTTAPIQTNYISQPPPAPDTNNQFYQALSNWGMFLATAVIAVFTVVLARNSDRQWRTLTQTFAVANRPKAVLRHIIVKGIDDGVLGKLSDGYAWITNTGVLPLTMVGFHAEWIYRRKLPLENPVLNLANTAVAPEEVPAGGFYKGVLPERDITTIEEHEAFWGEEQATIPKEVSKDLYLIGAYKYRDEIGMRRRYFCYRYSIRQNRFVEEDHPNYNYED